MKKLIYLILISAILLCTLVPKKVYAVDNSTEQQNNSVVEEYLKLESTSISQKIKIALDSHGIQLQSFKNEKNHIYFETKNSTTVSSVKVDLDLKNGQGFIKSNEASPEFNYKFSITELDENKMTVLFTDIKSGKVMPTTTHFTENNENIVYYVPLPPSVVIPGLGKLVEIMGKAVSSSEIIREGGKYLIDASKATSVANKDKSSYNYFMAKLSKDKLYIGDGINKAAAVKRGKSGKDVWAKSKSLARSLAASVNTKGSPVHDDAHGGEGYYAHYHPYKRTPKMHSFYGTSKK